jgi:hypothetical protein
VTEAQWLQLAEIRILNILVTRRFASLRQLEKKISEQGPSAKRPQPPHVTTALKNLVKERRVVTEQVGQNLPLFYMLQNFGGTSDMERRKYVINLYRQFHSFTVTQRLCGEALEKIVDKAANLGGMHTVLGPLLPGQKVNGVAVGNEIDHLLIPKDYVGPSAIVEDKNMREWLNPSSEQVWSVIGNAVKLPNAIPVLICRKMNFLAFRVFKRIEMMCWQVYGQYFDPSIEQELIPMRHKDGLGFSDITTQVEPPAALVRFFFSVIPKNSVEFSSRFEEHRGILKRYALDERLNGGKDLEGKQLHPSKRTAIYASFLKELQKRDASILEDIYSGEDPYGDDESDS